MKRMIFATAMLLTLGWTSSFANPKDHVDEQISKAFQKDFVTASNVIWENGNNFSKATFKLDGQVMYAYYNENAQLLGVVRNILSDKLPLNLMTDLKRNYNDHWITDLFELATDGQSTYYVTLENADETLTLKSDSSHDWTIYKRVKKN